MVDKGYKSITRGVRRCFWIGGLTLWAIVHGCNSRGKSQTCTHCITAATHMAKSNLYSLYYCVCHSASNQQYKEKIVHCLRFGHHFPNLSHESTCIPLAASYSGIPHSTGNCQCYHSTVLGVLYIVTGSGQNTLGNCCVNKNGLDEWR